MENPDINAAFMNSGLSSRRWGQNITNYMLFSYPIDVRSFQVDEYVVVVDFEVDSVSLFNENGTLVQSKPFSVGEDIKEVWQDKYNGGLYLYTRGLGNHKIYSLDILTGQTSYLTSLRDFPFTKSEKVYNGWLYFRMIENGYHGIHRLRLPTY